MKSCMHFFEFKLQSHCMFCRLCFHLVSRAFTLHRKPQVFRVSNYRAFDIEQYGLYSLTFRALALRQREKKTKNKNTRKANARDVRLYYPYWQYTDLFIFRLVKERHAHYNYVLYDYKKFDPRRTLI